MAELGELVPILLFRAISVIRADPLSLFWEGEGCTP